MTIRKAFLLGGLVLFCASTALAGERNRASAIRSGDVSTDSMYSNVREIAPGVATAEVNGAQLTVHANNTVEFADVVAEYGSTEAYMREIMLSQVQSLPGPNGMVYANGVMPFTREDVGQQAPISTVEEHKHDVPWAQQTVGGVDLFVFADGAVAREMSAEQPVSRSGIPSAVFGDGILYADGVMANE